MYHVWPETPEGGQTPQPRLEVGGHVSLPPGSLLRVGAARHHHVLPAHHLQPGGDPHQHTNHVSSADTITWSLLSE